jgi:hypothetical protein
MLDLDPRDYDSRDEKRHANTPSRGARGSSGDHDRDHDWRQPDARTRDRDDGRAVARAAPGTIGKGQKRRDETAITIPAGLSATATRANASPRSGDVFTRHVHLPRGRDRELVHDRIASTHCAAPNRGRSRPLERSEWSPVVIFETTTGARLIPGPATCDTCANKG